MQGIYLKRSLKVLDIILKKGRGSILSKLGTIQLIEVDLQLFMSILVEGRNNDNLERDRRLS